MCRTVLVKSWVAVVTGEFVTWTFQHTTCTTHCRLQLQKAIDPENHTYFPHVFLFKTCPHPPISVSPAQSRIHIASEISRLLYRCFGVFKYTHWNFESSWNVLKFLGIPIFNQRVFSKHRKQIMQCLEVACSIVCKKRKKFNIPSITCIYNS